MIRQRIILLVLMALWSGPTRGSEGALTVELLVVQETRVFRMDEVVELEVRIVNSTNRDVWLFGDLRWGARGGLLLNVGPWDRDGALPLVIDHAEFMPEELRDERSLVRLRPGAFLGRKRQVKVRDLVRKPGEYRLWVQYDSPVPADMFQQPFWSADKGSLSSRAVVVRVRRTTARKE